MKEAASSISRQLHSPLEALGQRIKRGPQTGWRPRNNCNSHSHSWDGYYVPGPLLAASRGLDGFVPTATLQRKGC